MADTKITEEIAGVIRRSAIADNRLCLPGGQLERKLYVKVNAVLEAGGGKWSKKEKLHIFPTDPRDALAPFLEAGVVIDMRKARQAFYTPARIADEIVEFAEMEGGERILEPSAGEGAIAEAVRRWERENITAGCVVVIELDPDGCDKLRKSAAGEFATCSDWIVCQTDFLREEPERTYDRVLMNPPFTAGQDVQHIKRALEWLKPGGRLLSIVPDADNSKLEAMGAVTVKRFPAGAFKESGTNVATRLIRIAA